MSIFKESLVRELRERGAFIMMGRFLSFPLPQIEIDTK